MWDFRIFILCFGCCGFSFARVELPEGFVVCKRNDPQIDKCFVDAANKVAPIIKKGNKALGLASIEALQIPPMKFVVGYEEAGLSFTIQLNDCILHHTLDKLTKAHVDLKHGNINIDALLSELEVVAKHKVSGRILFGNIRGQGRCKIIMRNLRLNIDITLSKSVRNNQTYLHADEYHFKIDPQSVSTQCDNIVGNNKNINDAINQVVNDNWQLVYEPHYPDIEQATAPAFQKVLNGLLDNVPMDVLFLED